MPTQTEQALENNLIDQLIGMGYERVTIADENDLTVNLRSLD